MRKSSLQIVGGAVMVAIPPALLEALNLAAGAEVKLTVDQGRLVVEPQNRRRYTLDELLAQCDLSAEIAPEEREWLDAPAVGHELI